MYKNGYVYAHTRAHSPSGYSSSSRSSSSSSADSASTSSSSRSSRTSRSSRSSHVEYYESPRSSRSLQSDCTSIHLLRIFSGIDPIIPRSRNRVSSRTRISSRDTDGRRYSEVRTASNSKHYYTHSSSSSSSSKGRHHRRRHRDDYSSSSESESESEDNAPGFIGAATKALGNMWGGAAAQQPPVSSSTPGSPTAYPHSSRAPTYGAQPHSAPRTMPPTTVPTTTTAATSKFPSRTTPVVKLTPESESTGPKVARYAPFVVQTAQSSNKVSTAPAAGIARKARS